MDNQTPAARDNVTPRELECEIADPSSLFSGVTEEKEEEEEERTAPPSSPCHGFHCENYSTSDPEKKQILIHLLTVAARVCLYSCVIPTAYVSLFLRAFMRILLPMCNFYTTFFGNCCRTRWSRACQLPDLALLHVRLWLSSTQELWDAAVAHR